MYCLYRAYHLPSRYEVMVATMHSWRNMRFFQLRLDEQPSFQDLSITGMRERSATLEHDDRILDGNQSNLSKLRCLSSTYRYKRQPKSAVSGTSCVNPGYLLDLSTKWPSSPVTQPCILVITCSSTSTVHRHMPILSETTLVYPRRFN